MLPSLAYHVSGGGVPLMPGGGSDGFGEPLGSVVRREHRTEGYGHCVAVVRHRPQHGGVGCTGGSGAVPRRSGSGHTRRRLRPVESAASRTSNADDGGSNDAGPLALGDVGPLAGRHRYGSAGRKHPDVDRPAAWTGNRTAAKPGARNYHRRCGSSRRCNPHALVGIRWSARPCGFRAIGRGVRRGSGGCTCTAANAAPVNPGSGRLLADHRRNPAAGLGCGRIRAAPPFARGAPGLGHPGQMRRGSGAACRGVLAEAVNRHPSGFAR